MTRPTWNIAIVLNIYCYELKSCSDNGLVISRLKKKMFLFISHHGTNDFRVDYVCEHIKMANS